VSYEFFNVWPQGFHAELVVTNDSATTIDGWTLEWTFGGGEQVTQLWKGFYDQVGADVTVTNESYNPTIPAGGGIVDFGFLAAWSGTNNVPTGFSLNGIPCTVN
jgi:hypothetical protein